MTDTTPRWIHRFENYKRAFLLLREAMEAMQTRTLNQLEKEGIIQRFEYTWELSWKLLKDYLESKGVVLQTITPSETIKAAYAAKIIENGEGWMEALEARNRMSHTYDAKTFERIIADIQSKHLALFDALHMFMMVKELEENPKS